MNTRTASLIAIIGLTIGLVFTWLNPLLNGYTHYFNKGLLINLFIQTVKSGGLLIFLITYFIKSKHPAGTAVPSPAEETNVENPQAMSIGTWVGTMLITAIPLIGIIMLFVWSFGNSGNKTKENWAKASLITGATILGISFLAYIFVLGVFFRY